MQSERGRSSDERTVDARVEETAWHALAVEDVLTRLDTGYQGLTEQEAASRLQRYGPNKLPEHRATSLLARLLAQFHNPLIYVLLAAAILTALLGHWVDCGVIVAVVVINAVIGLVQESKAEQAIESLRDMLTPAALVIRAGARARVPAADLVPGDIVLLHAGDRVPADVRVIDAKGLSIDESPLTGESVAVTKDPRPLPPEMPLPDRRNMAYSGTLVVSGVGSGVVVETGERTELGRVARMLREVQRVETPLIRRLDRFSRLISLVVVALSLLVFGVGSITGRAAVEMLMVAVALAVSAIPEGLPAIVSIALAIGVVRMARRNAVVRRLPAVEVLGSTTVICTDKTGTLTRNEMTVVRVVTPGATYQVEGVGYAPTGRVLREGTGPLDPSGAEDLQRLALAAVLCNDAELRNRAGQWQIEGDPTEGCLLVLASKMGMPVEHLRRQWSRTDVIPFDSSLQLMATLNRNRLGAAFVHLKGAPEAVFPRCGLDAAGRDQWARRVKELASEGLRVLAVACKPHDPDDVVLDIEDIEDGFELLGVVGMIDPPRPEAIEAVARCQAAGIRVIMVTGDHAETALAIARQIGIAGPDSQVLTGRDIDALDDAKFDQSVRQTNVLARVSPAHKLRLVRSLQSAGEVVAMTGDGINDAPALKQADIGVAMGRAGTDVAKEAADMVLLDDNFASIEHAVEEGRTVFDNLQKTILFILPTNGGECLALSAALVPGALLAILPLHVLWINLVTTVALAITLAFDPPEPDIMRRPPKPPGTPLVDWRLLLRVVLVSVLMAIGVYAVFLFEQSRGCSLPAARSAAVNIVVFSEVVYVLNCRRLQSSVLTPRVLLENRVVWLGIALVTLLQLAFTYWPVANSVFETAAIDAAAWARVIVSCAVLFAAVELEKRWLPPSQRRLAPAEKPNAQRGNLAR